MEHITIKEASEKWAIDADLISEYCSEGKIKGAIKQDNMWYIPINTSKPDEHNNITIFQTLYQYKELFVDIVKHFPYPMHICAPDGTMLLANDEFLKFVKKNDSDIAYSKINVLQDPNLERWGIKDFVERAYQGEIAHAYDVNVPFEEVVDLFEGNKELISECIFQNMTSFPIYYEKNTIKYIVTVFITSKYFKDRKEIVKGIEYINNHWKEKFDIDKLAETVHISRYHYARIFKQTTGMTPYQYYQDIKVKKLKEKLMEADLSIAEIFFECGVDYNGNFAKTFKKKVGMSPTEYRLAQTKSKY